MGLVVERLRSDRQRPVAAVDEREGDITTRDLLNQCWGAVAASQRVNKSLILSEGMKSLIG